MCFVRGACCKNRAKTSALSRTYSLQQTSFNLLQEFSLKIHETSENRDIWSQNIILDTTTTPTQKQHQMDKDSVHLNTTTTTHITLLDRENKSCYQFIMKLVETFGMKVIVIKERFMINNLSDTKIDALPIMFHNHVPFKVSSVSFFLV